VREVKLYTDCTEYLRIVEKSSWLRLSSKRISTSWEPERYSLRRTLRFKKQILGIRRQNIKSWAT